MSSAEAWQWVHDHHTRYVSQVAASPLNAERRTFMTPEQFAAHFRADWTEQEIECLTQMVALVRAGAGAGAGRRWDWVSRGTWRFMLADDPLEGGMPHTIHTAIVLPRWLLERFVQAPSDPRSLNTLVHERVHALQKVAPDRFARLYTERWGWAPLSGDVPPAVAERHRLNPDTPDTPRPWVAKRGREQWLPCARLRLGQTADLRAVTHFLVRVGGAGGGARELWVPMRKARWYTRFYGEGEADVNARYHPDETSADCIAHLVLESAGLGPPLARTPAVRALEEFVATESEHSLKTIPLEVR